MESSKLNYIHFWLKPYQLLDMLELKLELLQLKPKLESKLLKFKMLWELMEERSEN